MHAESEFERGERLARCEQIHFSIRRVELAHQRKARRALFWIAAAIAAIAICGLLGGCGRGMTNDEIIAETKKCNAAGLKPVAYYYELTQGISKIVCTPPE
jgi:hypothetical protein